MCNDDLVWDNSQGFVTEPDFIQNNNIRHNETLGASYQDNVFWFQFMCHAKRVVFLDFAGYYYCTDTPNS